MDERRPGFLRRAGLKRVRPPSWVTRWVAALGFLLLIVFLLDRLTSPALSGARVSLGPASVEPPVVAPPANLPPTVVPATEEFRVETEPGRLPVEAEPPSSDIVGSVPLAFKRGGENVVAPGQRAKPVSAASQSANGTESSTPFMMLTVPRGATVLKLLRDVYGREANLHDLTVAIQRLNPWIIDIDRIADGETLRLPWPPVAGERP
jgi:hypothetical protein